MSKAKNKIVSDLGALYISLCYTYTILDTSKKAIKTAYNIMKDFYTEEAQEAFPEEIFECVPEAEVTADMLFGLYDALDDAFDYELLKKELPKESRSVRLLLSYVHQLATEAMDTELLMNKQEAGEDMNIEEASQLVQDFLNGPWIKNLLIVKPGMLKSSINNAPETYGRYDKRKNCAMSYLEDGKAFMYMSRTNAIAEWFASELGNYSEHLKGVAGATDEEAQQEATFLSDLLSGIVSGSNGSTERDWAEGGAVDVTFTGVNLPGVALQISPIQFTEAETKFMAAQIKELNKLANQAEGICVTPESLLFGKNITVNMKQLHAKFSNVQEFKQYDLSLVNIDRPAQDLVDQIKGVLSKPEDERPELVTALFYGVPGSGKSMLANYLGSELNRPVLKKTYAELQSMYVGEGEKQLSEAFAEAEMEGAILLIDELDSIAGNRNNADKNYQKTFVNQLLTELDNFKGIFIATSNFMDGLDPAVLRRLFLKVKFDFLTDEQIETAFKLYFPKLKRSKLGHMPYLTPGDFRAVKEAAQFDIQKLSVKRVRELLQHEIDVKKLTLREAIAAEKTVGYHL